MQKNLFALSLITVLAGSSAGEAQFCSTDYDPVCGNDGVRYSNACFAESAGTTPRAEGALITFSMGAEPFSFWSENDAFIDEAIEIASGNAPSRIPFFGQVIAGSDCSAPNSFTVDPHDMEFADVAMELCDGTISYVEDNRDEWIEKVGSWCPWNVEILEIHDNRADGQVSQPDQLPQSRVGTGCGYVDPDDRTCNWEFNLCIDRCECLAEEQGVDPTGCKIGCGYYSMDCDAKVEFKNKKRNLCLDAQGYDGRSGRNVMLYHCDGFSDQRWYFDGMRIRNAMTGLCLDAQGYGGNSRDNVQLHACDGRSDQNWWIKSNGEIINEKNGLCLDVKGYQGKSRDNVMLYRCDGHKDQRWSRD